jgi:hypothetical protein
MRSIHADLTTAQQSASRVPYIQIILTSRDRGTTFTYRTTDANTRIAYVLTSEGRYGGGIQSAGDGIEYSCEIRLRDEDRDIDTQDFKGYRVDIDWGYNTTSGDKSDTLGPHFVFRQRRISAQGELYIELYCLSLLDYVSILFPNKSTGDALAWTGDTKVKHILMSLLAGSPATAVVVADDTVYSSKTTHAGDFTNTFDLLPAVFNTDDALYIGSTEPFDHVTIDLTTPGVGTWALAWQYYNGSIWSDLTLTHPTVTGIELFKNSADFHNLGFVAFNRPTNWAARNHYVHFATAFPNEDLYYIKISPSSVTGITTSPDATHIRVSQDLGVQLDTSDAAQDEDEMPHLDTTYQSMTKDITRAILESTLLGIYTRKEGFHLEYIDNTESSPDYTFSLTSGHNFFQAIQETQPVVPNKLTYVDDVPGSTTYSGSSENTASTGALGDIDMVLVDAAIGSNAEALLYATRRMKQLVRDANQGTFSAPLSVNLEMWDLVQIVDARIDETYIGRVSNIVRTWDYDAGRYDIDVVLGGQSAFSIVSYEQQYPREIVEFPDDQKYLLSVPQVEMPQSFYLPVPRSFRLGGPEAIAPMERTEFEVHTGRIIEYGPGQRYPESVISARRTGSLYTPPPSSPGGSQVRSHAVSKAQDIMDAYYIRDDHFTRAREEAKLLDMQRTPERSHSALVKEFDDSAGTVDRIHSFDLFGSGQTGRPLTSFQSQRGLISHARERARNISSYISGVR